MKLKKMGYGLVAALALVTAVPGSASAGAGEWDNIGSYTFSSVIRFQSGGGDLKVCVTSTTSKVAFTMKRSIIGGKDATTSGGTSNCAIWRSIGGPGYVDLTFANSNHPSSVKVTIYD